MVQPYILPIVRLGSALPNLFCVSTWYQKQTYLARSTGQKVALIFEWPMIRLGLSIKMWDKMSLWPSNCLEGQLKNLSRMCPKLHSMNRSVLMRLDSSHPCLILLGWSLLLPLFTINRLASWALKPGAVKIFLGPSNTSIARFHYSANGRVPALSDWLKPSYFMHRTALLFKLQKDAPATAPIVLSNVPGACS